ncbi:MAG: hypothetical protein HGA76_12545, partial [Candidatus Firestonebacteria bacterium]|nr:hypothetical protein [Candidatus Firestonebacteria bacterium]
TDASPFGQGLGAAPQVIMVEFRLRGRLEADHLAALRVDARHDYLWRCTKALPERGRIGIFNRSYYEEVLAVRVHPEILDHQKLPKALKHKDLWKERFTDINAYERYLMNNGTVVLKFFLNLSREEQKKRFLERINKPEKNWKFLPEDLKDRGYWRAYQQAYEDMFQHTSTQQAPWYIIPADKKWFTRMTVADIIVRTLKGLDLHHPAVGAGHLLDLKKAKAALEAEK